MDLTTLNEKLKSLVNEELDTTQTYEFKIKKIKEDELELTSGESVYSVYIYADDDLQDIRYAIEDFVDGELASDEDDSENITGTEVVGFKYDMETGEGEFEANIFFNESLNEAKKKDINAESSIYIVCEDEEYLEEVMEVAKNCESIYDFEKENIVELCQLMTTVDGHDYFASDLEDLCYNLEYNYPNAHIETELDEWKIEENKIRVGIVLLES